MSFEGGNVKRERYGGFEGVKPAEREFHESRWARIAAGTNKSVEDVMRAEAEADNKQYEKWASAEHQEQDENLGKFLKDWRAVRDDTSDRPKEFRLVRLMLGAGEESAKCNAQNMALADTGYAAHTDVLIGSSGASGPPLYEATGQSRNSMRLFNTVAMTPEFIKTGVLPKIDTSVMAAAMRNGRDALNVEALRSAPQEVYALVTNVGTGKAELMDMKRAEDPMLVCEASSAIPAFRDPVEIGGKKYMDGAFADVPLEEIIQKFKPTHLLIQPNKAFDFIKNFDNDLYEELIVQATKALGSVSKMIFTANQLYRMKERVGAVLKKMGDIHNVKIAVLWPPDEELTTLTNDPDIMRRGTLETYRKTISDLSEKQPETIQLLPDDDISDIDKSSYLAKAA